MNRQIRPRRAPLFLRDKTATVQEVKSLARVKGCTARGAGRTLVALARPDSGVLDGKKAEKVLVALRKRIPCGSPR